MAIMDNKENNDTRKQQHQSYSSNGQTGQRNGNNDKTDKKAAKTTTTAPGDGSATGEEVAVVDTNGNNGTASAPAAVDIVVDKDAKLDFDRILAHVGSFGPWQWKMLSLLYLVSLANGLMVVVYTFTGYAPKYRCTIPYCEFSDNVTYYKGTNHLFHC